VNGGWKGASPGFIKTLDAYRPRFNDQLELPFEYRPEEDDGKGL
jgi:hypothetical protein